MTPSKEQEREPWIGATYASFGHGPSRSCPEVVRHGISAGGGAWYSNALNLLGPGDRIWVKAAKLGFVRVGKVTGNPVPAQDFTLPTPDGDKPALEVLHEAAYHRDEAGDPERAAYFVPVDWLHTVPMLIQRRCRTSKRSDWRRSSRR